MLSSRKIIAFLLFSIIIFSSCEKEQILPESGSRSVNIDKYLPKDNLAPRKERVRIKKKRNKFKFRLIRKQRAL